MRWGALNRVLESDRLKDVDLVHIHTPFIAHYAGVRFARRMNIPCVATYHTFFEEYLHHYVPVLPRRIGQLLARAFHPLAVRGRAGAHRAVRSDARRPARVRRLDADPCAAYRACPPIASSPGRRRALPRPGGTAGRSSVADLRRPGRAREEHRVPGEACLPKCASTVPDAMLVIAGEGPARESLGSSSQRLGLEQDVHFVGYLDRNTALCSIATPRRMCSCLPRARRPRAWCCWRRWRRALRWCRRPSWVPVRC